jgi:hypothetical protein
MAFYGRYGDRGVRQLCWPLSKYNELISGLTLLVSFALFWQPGYTDPGRFDWRGAEGEEGVAQAASREEANAEVEEVLELLRGSDSFSVV